MREFKNKMVKYLHKQTKQTKILKYIKLVMSNVTSLNQNGLIKIGNKTK